MLLIIIIFTIHCILKKRRAKIDIDSQLSMMPLNNENNLIEQNIN